MPSSKVSHKSSIINRNQGGGNKKCGLYPSETRSSSAYLAQKKYINNLEFLMKLKPRNTQTTINLVINSASGFDHYVFDSHPNLSGTEDPTITINQGDILKIKRNFNGHEFVIVDENTDLTYLGGVYDSQYERSDVLNNGIADSTTTLTWDTTGVPKGIYYYVCTSHINMNGEIIIV